MRVAILGSRGYPSTYGGFETLVRHLAPFLARAGHQVAVYSRGVQELPREPDDPVQVRRVRGLTGTRTSTLSHGLAAIADAARRADDVVLVLNVAHGPFLPLLRRAGVPTVTNVDGIEWERQKWGPVARRVFRTSAGATARWSHKLVADSQAVADVWEAQFGRRPVFIPYGAELVDDTGSQRVEELGLRPHNYVLVVARLVPENNVRVMLAAADSLPSRTPVVIVGSGLAEEEAAVEAHQERRPATRWLGHVSDQQLLSELWANAAVYIHGHSVGGTNPALLQAMSHGCPVLPFRSPFNVEVTGSETATWANADDLADQLMQWLKAAPAACRTEGQRLQERVRDRYSWPAVCDAYLDTLTAACRCDHPVRD